MAMRQLVVRDGMRWTVTDQRSIGDRGGWLTTNEAVWPFPWEPIAHCQNLPAPNEFWGVSDLEDDVLAVNNAMNFILSNMGRIIRHHAHPKTYGSGFDASQIRQAIDETIILPNKNSKLANLEMQSDLSSSINLYEKVKASLHEIARIPRGGHRRHDRPGTGLRHRSPNHVPIPHREDEHQAPALRRHAGGPEHPSPQARRQGQGESGHDALAGAAAGGRAGGGDNRGELQRLGVSKDALLTNLGFDAEQEAEKKKKEQADMGDNLLQQFNQGAGQAPPGQQSGLADSNGAPDA